MTLPALCPLQLASNNPFAHWTSAAYNNSLLPGRDCVMGVANDRYDFFLGNSSDITGVLGAVEWVCGWGGEGGERGRDSCGQVKMGQLVQCPVALVSLHAWPTDLLLHAWPADLPFEKTALYHQ